MLVLTVKSGEGFDDANQKFVPLETFELKLEHSLVSLSKWESFFEKPFLGPEPHTDEEIVWYLKTMALNEEIPDWVWNALAEPITMAQINDYIGAKRSATWFSDSGPSKPNREIITAEIIYHWMISYNIWLEWENRHLNQLLTLIRVCDEKAKPPKKMTPGELAKRQRSINAQRRAAEGHNG